MNDDSRGTDAGMRQDAWSADSVPDISSSERGLDTRPASDLLSGLLRREAATLLGWAIEAEFEAYYYQWTARTAAAGRRAVVRNGYQPTREVDTNLGLVPIRLPKVRSRGNARAAFRSNLVRPYLRRTRVAMGEAPAQFLRALAGGNVLVAITAILGREAAAFSPSLVKRLSERWTQAHKQWLVGPLDQVRIDLLWVDRVPLVPSQDDRSEGVLLAAGVGHEIQGRMLALKCGVPDTTASWTRLLRGLRDRGLRAPPRWGSGESVCAPIRDAFGRVFPDTSAFTL